MKKYLYSDGFMYISKEYNGKCFYCDMKRDYFFLPILTAEFIVKRLKMNMKLGYRTVDNYKQIRKERGEYKDLYT